MASATSSLRIFVYGTLKPGYRNHDRYCRDRLIDLQPAQVRGSVYSLPVGYPGMTHGDGWVKGFLLTLREDGQTLADLDNLEDYNPNDASSPYQRELAEVFTREHQPLGQAWAYFMAIATIQALNGQLVASGDWRSES